jgi:GTP-binding protein HflX
LTHETEQKIDKVILIAVVRKGSDRAKTEENLQELERLADTAGAEVVDTLTQELEKPNPATALGTGKVQELKLLAMEHEATLVIFDDELSPAQVRNLEKALEIKVMDRSGLILDIFANHAKTVEAKTQVELAQLEYLLPRLTRMWTHLSKQYGGIGTKGPGETQIETDRRIIRERIQKLKAKLKDIDKQKDVRKKGRQNLPRFALVGYTNAGKSTLMNAISGSDVYVEDKLFATLDTTVRAFDLPSGLQGILSDTVGFIRKLPTHLIASFRSTLQEAADADVLLHVVDASHEGFRDQIMIVDQTLESLKISDKPTILVFNKIDVLEEYQGVLKRIENEYPNSVFVSAKRNMNINRLLEVLQYEYDGSSKTFEFTIPYEEMANIAKLYDFVEIVNRNDSDMGIDLLVKVNREKQEHFKNVFGKYLN